MFLKKLYKILLIVFTVSLIDIINAMALTPNIGPPIMASNVADDKQRYYCVELLLGSSDEGTTTLMEQAAAAGSNAVMLVVDWGYVYKDKNSSANWANLDKKVKRARELGLKIFIRVNLSRHSSVFGDFWTDAESMIDGAGNKLDNNGRSFSFGAQTVVDRALAFVKETAVRYNYAQQAGDLLAISVVTTPTQEAGYHFSNENSNGAYSTLFDYSPLFLDGFQLWLKNKYKDIRRLNEVWFSAYGIIDSFDNVNPPFDPNYLQGSFAFKSGLDWYLYRHQMLKKFMDSVSQTIKNVNPTYKVINEYGSVYDGLGQRRGTFGFRDLGTNTDGIKINNEHSSPHKFSTDLMRSNLPGKWIMNEMFPEPNVPISEMFRFGDECFEHGCKLITFVVADQKHLDYFKPAITYFKQKWLNVPLEVIKPAATMTVKLSEILNGNGYDQPGYKAQWNELYEQYKKPIEILLAEDIIQKEGNIAPTIDAGITNQSTVMGFSWKFQIPSDAFQDVDGFVASYETTGLPNGLLLKNSTIIGTPTVAGKFQITVKCFDNSNASVSTNFTLVVKAASKIDIQLYKSGTLQTRQFIKTLKKNDTLYLSTLNYAVNFMAVADGSVAAVNLKMTGAINQEKLDANTPYSLFDDNGGSILKVGQYTITANSYSASTNVSASNGIGWQEVNFTVLDKPKNTAPTVQNLIPNQTAKANNSFSLSIPTNTFKDAESAISRIQITGLPAGLTANGWSISGKSSQKGSFVIVVEAFDADGLSVKTQFTILINAANEPPYLEYSLSDQTIISGNKFKYDAVGYAFNDRDGSIAKIEVTGLPPGLTYKDGFISGISTAIGSYLITARATDNEGATASTTFKIIINDSKPKNTAPIVARVVGNQTAKVGINFSFSVPDLTFEDAEKNINRITITGLAPGLSANNLSISGIPTQSGSFTVTLEAFDTGGLSVKTQFVIVVSPANIPPYLEYSLSDQTIISGNKFKYDAVGYAFNDKDGTIAKIEVTGLPPELTYKDGLISGTPTTLGVYEVTAKATDNEGASVSATFKITVKDSKPIFEAVLISAGDVYSRRQIMVLTDGKIITSALPSLLNIYVSPASIDVDRIDFEISGTTQSKNSDSGYPYSLYEGEAGFISKNGKYQLKIISYLKGKSNGSQTINFEIKN
jgi:Beta-galactosidase/Putative Ig domain